jgi:LPXTG-motif cell wall-anchored protein
MSMRMNLMIALVAVVAMGATAAFAQSTTYEIRQGTVLYVDGNNLYVKMADGTVKNFDVPPDFRFDVDGQQVPVSALKPGTQLTQTIATTTTPVIEKSVEVRNAEIVQRIGQTIIYRDELGQIHKLTGIPEGWIVYRDGKPVPIEALAGGDRVTAYIVHKDESTVTEEEMNVAGSAPKAPPKPRKAAAPKPAPAPAAAPAPAPVLPKTGSSLPLVGLLGLAALAAGLGIGVIRRV